MGEARPIKASNKGNYRGSVPSTKCGTMIKYESLLERDYIYLLEFDSKVEYYESQPLKIPYMYLGSEYKYFPDFKVITNENIVKVVEVKPTRFLKKEKNLVKFEVGKQFCVENSWDYLVVSEDKIRVGHLQYNLKKLRNAEFQSIRTNLKKAIIKKVKEIGSIKIDTFIKEEFPQLNEQEIYSHIYYLIYKHQLYTDLINQKLSKDSIISIAEQGDM